MPESVFAFGDQPDELAQTDLLLDALADRRPVRLDDPDEDVLATLLEDWRDNLRWPPASALVAPEEAIQALHIGLSERRRGRRGLAAIGSVAAALLVLSGFGAMVVEARPGDALYGLHAMFFDQPKLKEDQVMLSAKADLAKVQPMIDQGQWDQAEDQLAAVSSVVQSMNDGPDRRALMDQVNLLNIRVESRNPNATLPPPAASTTSPGWSAPTSTDRSAAPSTSQPSPSQSAPPSPSQSASPSPSQSASPSPSSGRHRHHGHTTSPSPVVGSS